MGRRRLDLLEDVGRERYCCVRLGGYLLVCGEKGGLFPRSCLLGPDRGCVPLTLALLLGPSIFLTIVVSREGEDGERAAVALAVTTALCAGTYLCTALADPGIVLKERSRGGGGEDLEEGGRGGESCVADEVREDASGSGSGPSEAAAAEATAATAATATTPRVITTTQCSSCGARRLPGTMHCGRCGVCISKLDHHCPWVGKCVGRDNMRIFQAFTSCLCLHVITFFAIAAIFFVFKDPSSSP